MEIHTRGATAASRSAWRPFTETSRRTKVELSEALWQGSMRAQGDRTEPGDKPSPANMALTEVLTVLEALDTVGCQYWLEGGWGVDALVGQQTRPHRDL